MAERVPTVRGQGNERFVTVQSNRVISRGQTVPYDVNGAPSGGDADTLDGQDGVYYLARANHTGTQTAATISDFTEAAQDAIAALLAAGANISLSYNDVTNTLTIAVTGLGSLAFLSTINNTNWSGADLDITNGGTGASSAAAARTNLGIIASNIPSTATGDVAATDVQAAIAELASEKLASTSYTAADVLTKIKTVDGTGSGLDADLLQGTTPTAFGLSLIDDANSAAARTTLGLVIGTDVQAQDAQLAAMAGLTPAADQVIYWTSATAAAMTGLTTFGRSLIDDADAAAARTTLGLGSISTQAANNVAITGGSFVGLTGDQGIGTASPTTYLDGTNGLTVYHATSPGLAFANASQGFLFYISGTTWFLWDTTGNSDLLSVTAAGSVGIGGTTSFGSGNKVLGIPNASTVPSANPTNGGVLYCQAGALKYRGSSGTVTTLGVA